MKKDFFCLNKAKSKNYLKQVEQFIKIINEPNRLKILCLLQHKKHCVCDIGEPLNMPQNLLSHHLKVLKDFGLINCKKEGRKVIYSTNKRKIKKNILLLNKFLITNL